MLRALARVCAVLVASSVPVAAAETAPAEGVPFGVSGAEVVAERDVPQACFTFTDRLEKSRTVDYRDHVEVVPVGEGAAFEGSPVARDRTLCVEGLRHGQKYRITLREGLPGGDGRSLAAADSREIEVPNRKPSLAFRGAGYILPRIGADGLPLRSINLDRARLQVLRINDRSLVEKIYFGRIAQQLSDHEVGEILDRAGQEVWRGEMAISNVRNQAVVTPFPIDAVLGRLDPGVYIAVAGAEEVTPGGWDHKATQWFVVSDLGLNTIMGEDALVVFARSVSGATPEAGVELRLLARNNAELGKVSTGPDGIARFDLAALRAAGGEAPQALFAYRGAGDFGFLDLAAPAGGTARPAPGQPDAFLYTERGIYRPGETVNLAVLLRDADAKPVAGRSLTLRILRPDGFEVERRPLADAGGGGFTTRIGLPGNAYPGPWTVTVHADAEPGATPSPAAGAAAPAGGPASGAPALGPALGRVEFLVEDFVPPRLDVALTAADRELPADGRTVLTIDGHFLYGAPAAGLPGQLAVTLRAAENPYPNLPGYRFGLAQEEVAPQRSELPGFTTNRNGQAEVELGLPKPPESTRPLEAVVRATLLDVGGRSVSRDLILPVRHQPFAIGIRPRFEGEGVPEGATASFDVLAVSPDGTPVDREELSYELFEEEHDYVWFEANGRWDYKVTVRDQRVTGGSLATQLSKPGTVEAPVNAGRYRLEVFDPKTGVATSLRFAAGWWMTPTDGERPDEVDVTVMLPSYRGGETARVHVKPPYDSQVFIAVADRRVRHASTHRIGPEGAFLEIPVDPAWTGGVYVLATAFATPDPQAKGAPRRAVGLSWLSVDAAQRTLDLRIEAPATTEPRRQVNAELVVEGAAEGQPAYVTLAAVDDAVSQLTERRAPDPKEHYLGKRRLAVELRDSFGRLIDPVAPDPARVRPGGATRLRPVGVRVPQKSERVVSLFSGILPVGAGGRLSVPLEVPDFQGRLRLTAVAWSGDRLGYAESRILVRDPVLADLAVPRFLAPGDRAVVPVSLDNAGGPAGSYRITLTASGAVSLDGSGDATASLGRGKRVTMERALRADSVGVGHVTLDLVGPDGLRVTRRWEIPVRPGSAPVIRRAVAMLAPDRSVAVPADLTAGLRPETVSAALSLGILPEIDVPGLLTTLERSGTGGLEAAASRALPLLVLGDVAVALGLDTEERVKARVQRAVDRVLTMQRPDGSFAAWSPKGESDSWLTAYALDILGRARASGYRVPEAPYRKGLDGLKAALDNAWVEAEELPGRAYALHVLARAKMVDAGAVRYFQETFWDKLPTDFARAQVAAALAALGEGAGAAEAFDRLTGARIGSSSLRDYGSPLRDDAGVVVLMAESGAAERERLDQAAERLAKTYAAVRVTGAQEQAWLLLAAKALVDRAPAMKVAVGEQVMEGAKPLFQRIDPASPPALRNAGGEPLRQIVSVVGVAEAPPEPEEQGISIARRVFDMAGNPVDLKAVRQNDRLVVVLEGGTADPVDHQALVSDPLPAGFEIETVRLAGGAPLGELSWLGELTVPRHVEYRDDRFVAAVELTKQAPRFRLAYLVRAMTSGDFALPGATVEDPHRPHRAARTAAARLHVLPE